jgi:hypothetical protein
MAKKTMAVALSALLWSPSIQLFFPVDTAEYRQDSGISPKARLLAERHLEVWRDPVLREAELDDMQKRNPEWDFMSRTYLVLALANMALHDEDLEDIAIEIMDEIIWSTLATENERGHGYFLLGYARQDNWVMSPPRSHFIDGEIAMMVAARRLVREEEQYIPLLQERVQIMIARMEQSPVGSAESYPNECWLFCNTVGLAAIRMMDSLDGTDHSGFLSQWVGNAKENLSNPATGMLISSYEVDGTPAPTGHCPEGSSIFMSAHMLELVDPAFARDQYQRAKDTLEGSFLGFGFAREWPEACVGRADIDSGPIVPFLEASASASGMAVLGASVFGDEAYLESLLRSLELMGFPVEDSETLLYEASNPVGDAVLLYGMVEGPLWKRVLEAGQ